MRNGTNTLSDHLARSEMPDLANPTRLLLGLMVASKIPENSDLSRSITCPGYVQMYATHRYPT